MAEEHGWSARSFIPHGGHQLSLNIAGGLGLGGSESYPDVFKPFNGFADGVAVEDGYVGFPDLPGLGIEDKAALKDVLKNSRKSRELGHHLFGEALERSQDEFLRHPRPLDPERHVVHAQLVSVAPDVLGHVLRRADQEPVGAQLIERHPERIALGSASLWPHFT